MIEEQYQNFVYGCQSLANNAHFDTERFITNFLGEEKVSFSETIMKYQNVVEKAHFGVCFSYACWAYHLLWTMGITNGYYLMETVEKDTGYPNYVLLLNYNGEYRICDLAAQVIHQENIHEQLLSIARFPEMYTTEDKEEILKSLADTDFISQSVKDYFKNYDGGIVFAADDIEDERIFSDIPQVFLNEFLKSNDVEQKFKI